MRCFLAQALAQEGEQLWQMYDQGFAGWSAFLIPCSALSLGCSVLSDLLKYQPRHRAHAPPRQACWPQALLSSADLGGCQTLQSVAYPRPLFVMPQAPCPMPLQACPCTPEVLLTGNWTHGDQGVLDRANYRFQGNGIGDAPHPGWWYMLHGGTSSPAWHHCLQALLLAMWLLHGFCGHSGALEVPALRWQPCLAPQRVSVWAVQLLRRCCRHVSSLDMTALCKLACWGQLQSLIPAQALLVVRLLGHCLALLASTALSAPAHFLFQALPWEGPPPVTVCRMASSRLVRCHDVCDRRASLGCQELGR